MNKRSLMYLVFIVCLAPFGSAFCSNAQSLLPDERNTVEVFQKSSSKVVFVHRLASVHRKQMPDGSGTGIIWDDKGHVVTNFHVIKGADELEITLGKMTVPAKVVGKEPRMDIAVLQIKNPQALAYLKSYHPFKIVHLGDLMVGQKAIAIGNPYGLDHSLSKGVVSALGRDVPGSGGVSIPNMIQTDTPINPGNSGGPLLNSTGDLIGINTIIYSRTGSSAGIGFAIPADDIDRSVTQIINNGRVILSGIGIKQVDPEAAFKLGIQKGILISDILPNTPAARAGLHGTQRNSRGRVVPGDVIVALNAHQVGDYDVLYNLLTKIKVGEKITVTIQRGGKQMDIAMKTIDVAALDTPYRKQPKAYHSLALSV